MKQYHKSHLFNLMFIFKNQIFMKRIVLIGISFLFVLGTAWAQRTISGIVTSDDGSGGIPGVNVVLKGTTTGTTTDFDGNYRFSVPEEGGTLLYSSIGLADQEQEIGARSVIDIVMTEDIEVMADVIITGVAGATDRKKLAFTVGKINEDLIQNTPGVNAATALQGKIAGVSVITASGEPGRNSDIVLRGAANLVGSNNPLIIIDGVLTDGNGNLRDINSEDIANIEVVKGAAAAALYGSRAANGVINITTKRGADKGEKTTIKVRSELGQSKLNGNVPLATHHPYNFNDDGSVNYGSLRSDGLAVNPYATNRNHIDDLFNPGSFQTYSVSVGSTSEDTRFYASYTNNQQSGVVDLVDGFSRNSILLNLDHELYKNLNFSASSSYITSFNDQTPEGSGGSFYTLLYMPPDINLNDPNEEDGSMYDWDVAKAASLERNPLYRLSNQSIEDRRKRFLGSYSLEFSPLEYLSFEGRYTIDREDNDGSVFTNKGYLSDDITAANGNLTYYLTSGSYSTTSLKSTYTKTFGDFDVIVQGYYLEELRNRNYLITSATNFLFAGIQSLGNATLNSEGTNTLSANSGFDIKEVTRNYSGIGNVVYQDKLILDGMFRRDGSSLFGSGNKWNSFYRGSVAYRLTEDIDIPGVDEFKLRASIGTAGNRPEWGYQYETLSSGGQKSQTGNKDLKSSQQQEIEIGIDARFLDKIDFMFNYVQQKSTDMFFPRQLEGAAGGFTTQWINLDAQLDANIIEASVSMNIFENKAQKSSLNAGMVFSAVDQTLTKFNYQATQIGANNAFIYQEGEKFGTIYGRQIATSLDELTAEEASSGSYSINSDGFVVTQIGTPSEGVVYKNEYEADGTTVKSNQMALGNIIADFQVGLNATYNWKGFTAYILFDWKQGGDIYNQTKQWTYRELRAGDIDQSSVVQNLRKPVNYYSSLYNVNATSSYFVEDGSYVKLRELNVRYTYKPQGTKVPFKQVTLGIVGRNLWTMTNYSGYDPEVGSSGNGQNWAFDGFSYPNFATVSGSLELKF